MMARDWRDDRVAEQDAQIAQLKAELAGRDCVIVKLMAQVAELEEQLRRSSKNSSKPPSSDPPWLLRGPKKPPSGRKPGGQPGHKKSERAQLPPDKVDETQDIWPAYCEGCQRSLRSEARTEVSEVIRHQVIELPEMRARVTEYRLHTQCCPHCEWATLAKLPEGVATGCFGPRLTAVVALCSGVYRRSKRMVVSMRSDLFGVEMALGSVTACEQRTSELLAGPVAEACHPIEQQSVVYADETGWRQARARAWLGFGSR